MWRNHVTQFEAMVWKKETNQRNWAKLHMTPYDSSGKQSHAYALSAGSILLHLILTFKQLMLSFVKIKKIKRKKNWAKPHPKYVKIFSLRNIFLSSTTCYYVFIWSSREGDNFWNGTQCQDEYMTWCVQN